MDPKQENQTVNPQGEQTQQQPNSDKPQEKQTDVWAENFNVADARNESLNINTDEGSNSKGENSDDDGANDTTDWNAKYQAQRESDSKLQEPILVKYKGKVIDINEVGELRDLAEKGIAATSKLQEVAEIRKQLNGITDEDLELLKRFKAGDMSVAEELATPRETVDEGVEQVNTIAAEILEAPYQQQFKELVSVLPQADRTLLSSDARTLSGLKMDFDNGIAQKLMPLVERNITVKGMPFIDAYKAAGIEMFSGKRNEKAQQLSTQPAATSSIKEQPQEDIWSMDSDKFKTMMSRGR